MPPLVSDDHALLALGAMVAAVADRGVELLKDGDTDAPIPLPLRKVPGYPEPSEWLTLWNEAVERTSDQALEQLRARLGAAEPTMSERLEVETIAQAHYESYCRLDPEGAERVGGFVAWEALPDGRRSLMKATVADMIVRGIVHIGHAAAHPKGAREVWVIFDGLPGPARECCFVETGDAAGRGVGANVGLRWERCPGSRSEFYRLGPFPAPRVPEPRRPHGDVLAIVREAIAGEIDYARLPGLEETARRVVERLEEERLLTGSEG